MGKNTGKNHKTSLGMEIKGNLISGIQGVNLIRRQVSE
jgi:hypothetical protein